MGRVQLSAPVQFQSSFSAVSEFQCSFRVVSEHWISRFNLWAIYPLPLPPALPSILLQCSFRAVSEQFQSSFRAVSEQSFWISWFNLWTTSPPSFSLPPPLLPCISAFLPLRLAPVQFQCGFELLQSALINPININTTDMTGLDDVIKDDLLRNLSRSNRTINHQLWWALIFRDMLISTLTGWNLNKEEAESSGKMISTCFVFLFSSLKLEREWTQLLLFQSSFGAIFQAPVSQMMIELRL